MGKLPFKAGVSVTDKVTGVHGVVYRVDRSGVVVDRGETLRLATLRGEQYRQYDWKQAVRRLVVVS